MLPTPVTSRPPVESLYRNPLPPHSFPFSLLNEWKVSRGSESCTSALPPATTAGKEVEVEEEEEEGADEEGEEEEEKKSLSQQYAGVYCIYPMQLLTHKQKARLQVKPKKCWSWRRHVLDQSAASLLFQELSWSHVTETGLCHIYVILLHLLIFQLEHLFLCSWTEENSRPFYNGVARLDPMAV